MSRFVVLVLVFLFACGDGGDGDGSKPVIVLPPLEHNSDVLLLGDSITFDLPSQTTYADHVEDAFRGGSVKNVSFPGWTTQNFLPTGRTYAGIGVAVLKPEFCSIYLGTNDTGFPLSASVFKSNMTAIASALVRDGCGSVIINSPGRYFSPWRDFAPNILDRDRFLAQYVDAIFEICNPPGDRIICGPVFYDLLEPEHTDDGLHPNFDGHVLIADHLLRLMGFE